MSETSPLRQEGSYMPETSPPRQEDPYMPETSPPRQGDSYMPETSSQRHEDSYIPQTSPPSPSQQAFERREERRKAYQAASLPELLFEAARVFVMDKRNIAIMVLGVLVVGLALRGSKTHEHFTLMNSKAWEVPTVEVSHAEIPDAEQVLAPQKEAMDTQSAEGGHVQKELSAEDEPEVLWTTETLTEREVVRLVETITETVKFTATESEAEVETEAAAAASEDAEPEADIPSSESDNATAEVETVNESAPPEPEVDTPESESGTSESVTDVAVEEAGTQAEDTPRGTDVSREEAEVSGDDPSEAAADPPAHEEL